MHKLSTKPVAEKIDVVYATLKSYIKEGLAETPDIPSSAVAYLTRYRGRDASISASPTLYNVEDAET